MRRTMKKIRFILAWAMVVLVPAEITVIVLFVIYHFNELWMMLPITLQGVCLLGIIFITNFVEDRAIEDKRVFDKEYIEDDNE